MAGGQATNAGINYQQRVAAFFMVNQFAGFDISNYIDKFDKEILIERIHFESDTPIDDIVLECNRNTNIYLQIKRSLSLSIKEDSDFSNVLIQFVNEFIKHDSKDSHFGLITTSESSSKIIYDLKKLFVSIGLNELAFEQNPLNESEKETLDKFRTAFTNIFKSKTGVLPTELDFINFAKRCFVSPIDIEEGQSLEIAAFLLLRSLGFDKPTLIWALLIKNGLYYSSERLSIEKTRMKEILENYSNNQIKTTEDEDFFNTEYIFKGEFSAGKEVLLIESFLEEVDFLIVELYRFTDDCRIKSVFYENKIRIPSGDEWTIIQRFATMTGIERYMIENEGFYKDKRIAILPANDIDTVEDSECAKLHKSKIESLLNSNPDKMLCLHCGKSINTNNAFSVEVEDRDTVATVGSVHKECLRPIDRIMGIPYIEKEEIKEYLSNFNFKLWVKLRLKGQGMMNGLKNSPNLLQGRVPVIAWNSTDEYDADYSYCIRFILEDKTFAYDIDRGKVARYNKIEAKNTLDFYLEMIDKFKSENDPKCFTAVKRQSGRYSELIKSKNSDDEILEVVTAEVVKYSNLIAKLIESDISYYSPMCLLRDRESERLINLGNIVPLITDPIYFESILKNWQKVGINLEPLELKIIKSDKDFDNVIRMILRDNMVPIIDPEFDKNNNLVKGYPIQEFHEIIEKHGKKPDNK